ncbi:hypothetical protein [Methanosarcina barkeri]|uniref:Uncharacterized protein n=2 Tax=Methanosarcina barkeri TaxID=2208 RepID=A0A0G3C9V9_METBA|nr:hypothetical protein [Methanosarcina barkeri]AKB59099.1 hypothetical protein MSBR2_2583 [Methanosarcina barkeri 227]AKJ38774.1 hypothetical protein MCM1_1745 [Methanosarcina barkeri CM1]
MLPEEIKLIKPVFTFIKNPKNKESLKLLFLLSVFLFLILSPGAAASSNWELNPQNPAAGDIIEIKGTGFEGDTAKAQVSFEKDVEVQDGEYEYLLEDVVIPSSSYNSFTVQAEGVEDLNVRAKMLLWITKSGEAKDGTATVTQTNVPAGTYEIRIDGKASGSNVKLKITATQEIEVDSDGSISYLYSTKSIPAGDFEVNVGDTAKQVELQSEENLSSEQNLTEEQNNENLTSETNSSEQNLTEEQNNGSSEDTSQKELKTSGGNSQRASLISSSENSTGDNITNISSVTNKISSLMRIKSILETPKSFIAEDIKPYIQANSLSEVLRNPPKLPSFLLGFAGTLLIGLVILMKKKK